MAYSPHNWNAGDPITEERMNTIENAIAAASSTADSAIKPNDSTFTNVTGRVTSLENTVGRTDSEGLRHAVISLQTTVEQSAGSNGPGAQAMNQILSATTNHQPSYNNLDDRFSKIERYTTQVENATTTMNNEITHTNNKTYSNLNLRLNEDEQFANQLQTEITNARTYTNSNGETSTYNNLVSRLNHTDQSVDLLNANYNADTGRITTIENSLKAALDSTALSRTAATNNAFLSIDARMEASEQEMVDARGGEANLNARLNKINTELDNAHESTSYSKTGSNKYSSIDARFEAIETEIKNARGGAVNIDARLDTIDDSTTAGSLVNRVTTLEGTSSSLNTNLNTVTGRVTTLETTVGNLDTAYKAADSALDSRLDAIESTINSTDTGLAERTTALENSVTNIANELSMTNIAGEIKDTTSRIDQLEANTIAMANEIGMLQNGAEVQTMSEAITGQGSRIDTLETVVGNSTSGLVSEIALLESTITNNNTGLAATKAIADQAKATADAAATAADLTALTGRVSNLENEPKSATVIINKNVITYNNDGVPTNIGETPSQEKDYLLQSTDDKYYYWKYIGTSPSGHWELISGAGGSGTSSAEFYAALTDIEGTPSDTIDYFIGTGSNYMHYRWRNNEWVQILPAHLINSVTVDKSRVSEGITKSKPVIKEIGSENNLLSDFTAIKSISSTTEQNGSTTLTWVSIDGEVGGVTITGGGGGSSTGVTVTIDRITNSNITTISGEPCVISYTYSAVEANGDPYETIGQGTWFINGTRVTTQEVFNGTNTIDLAPYLYAGTNNISLSVTISVDGQNITRTKTWVINVVNFSLIWEYNESTIQSGSTINFSCTPYGTDITKTLHLKVGNNDQTQTVTTSGIPVTVSLTNNFAHGNYTAEMWMTAIINGVSKETNHISHDFIVVEQGNNTPIIAATLPSNTMDQYDTITIPFVVYTPNSSLSTVTLAVDGMTQDVREDVNRATQTWNYTPSTSGAKVLTITSGTTTKTLNLTVNSVSINNTEIDGYVFKLKASELPSNSALQSWHYDDNNVNNTKLQFSNNFDWINGGIKTENDENGQLRQYIRIKSGTTMSIPYQMFSNALPDPRINGCNFKIIFKVENCRNYDAVVATNVANNIGIQLNAHNAIFKSTTTQISTQYGENEYTELEFEIYKNHTENNQEANNPYMMAWIDGVMTSARPYDGNFTQTDASNIIIGSNDCDVCIYLVKYYPTVLAIADHISNFIADAPNASEMIKRFNRNDILYTDSTDIDPNKLAQKNRDCRVWLYDIPRMTTGKKDYVAGVGFQQIYKNGTAYQDGLHGVGTLTVQGTSSVNYRKGAANTDINFYDTKDEGRLAVCELYDGEENNLLYNIVNGEQVVKPVAERGYKINSNSTPITYSNMKVNFASCEQVNNMCNAEWYQQFQPYPSLSTRDCMEFAMGVQFIHDQGIGELTGEVILFNEKGANRDPNKYYMYSIGNLGTSKKNTHIFHSNNECCVEVMNNQNAGCRMISVPSDLDADYTAYLNENYEGMTNYDWGGDVKAKDHSYEMRFPDTKSPAKEIKAGWARFVKWMAENNPGAATNATISSETYEPYTFKGHKRAGTQVLQGTTVNQYAGTYTTDSFERRMAKMLSECEDYMAMDSVIYHFLFIERHTMVDNVAKNTFWSAAKTNQYINGVEQEDTEGYWIWDLSKNYDNDTSDGNNNEGQLIFDYGNEAADRQDGKAVFNASDAVWFVFASNLYEACQTMFQNRESAMSKNGKWQNAWSASNYHAYLLSEQRKVPERVWNECYWYDYLRTYETGKVYNEETDKDTQIIDKSWITFLDGGQKTHQRRHYETFEELYDASKYRSNFSTANSITLRGYTPDPGDPSLLAVHAKSEISVKMYNKCYLTAHFDNNIETQKAERGQLVTLQFLESNGQYMNLSDTVIKIDTASMIQEIGDLAPLYPGQASFSAAIRLRSIKIGDSTEGYNNPHITNTETGTVDFGANYMLEHLEVQNLSNANQPLNLTGCPALTYLDASGSSFTSIVFANGGLLTEAYINNPTNLVMRNLDLLTKSNFHLADPTAVTQLRLEGCKLFDKQTFVEELTNLNIIRLSGINWTLSSNTLLERLLGIMGMNELGYTVAQSYLAGSVELTGIVYGGDYNEYLAAWSPDLTIDVSHASQFIAQHLVTYKDEDGTILATKYINHGSNLVDIVATSELVAPSKPDDISSTYTFGELQYSVYIPYSGWRYSADSVSIYATYGSNPNVPVNGDTTVYAVYSSTPKQYVVRWLVDNKIVATTEPQNYGGGYNLSAPTIKDAQSAGAATCSFTDNGNGTCRYRIMTGWEKLPTNISPTDPNAPYDIHATWLERTDVSYDIVLTNNEYSVEEKLLILKNIQSARSSLSIQDLFPVTLGYDGNKTAINLLSTPKYYTGTADTIEAYTPFAANKSFTIAIDYRFEHVINDSASEAVLLSCYDDSNGSIQGFKLFYNPRSTNANPVPQISFGDTGSTSNINQRVYTIGSTIKNRGVVVLRHIAGESILYVYSGANSSGLVNNYAPNEFRKTLTWAGTASNAKIILGGISSSSSSSINARGTIYSVKYWEEDLGEGECVQLANWCHETMSFAVEDVSEKDTHCALPIQNANLVLHTLNASQMGTIIDAQIDASTETSVGWDPSTIRTFYNTRLFQALPIKLQSIMTPVGIKHVKAYQNENGYSMGTNDSTTLDYIFAPSYRETGISNNIGMYSLESSGTFIWSGLKIMQYSNGSFIEQNSNTKAYINLRFPYSTIAINANTKVYIDYPSANGSFESYASTNSLGLKTGDILIPADDTAAYIYIGSSDILKGAPFIPATSGNPLAASNGAWIESVSWWTRSVAYTGANGNVITGRNTSRFTSINKKGNAQAGNMSAYRENGLVYSIAL